MVLTALLFAMNWPVTESYDQPPDVPGVIAVPAGEFIVTVLILLSGSAGMLRRI